jgi:hypothetical protein
MNCCFGIHLYFSFSSVGRGKATSPTLTTLSTSIFFWQRFSYQEKISRAQGHAEEQVAKNKVIEVQAKVATKD